ncbi:MAG: DUF2608 domain-containing protein [Verrucomicrobia bacterium]|nr:DUF2608 domain-containing protein [Verrucomicrobiota bacterium]MBU6446100.1 DUF2608 domain-containing protein [Verrucomicrobiota bacterium]
MTNIQGIKSIQSLEELDGYLDPPLAGNDEWGILLIDFDQTLVQARPTLGDEHFYHFLKKCNEERGINPDAHYEWTVAIRAKIPYETCESVDKINRVISAFRQKGWSVKVLTSRGEGMRDITKDHLQQSRLALSLEDIIFKTFQQDGIGKLLKKNESLIDWMKGQSKWSNCQQIRILFLDDSDEYCQEVAGVAAEVKKATVSCFHYIGAPPNSQLSEVQMDQLVVQLDAYQKGEQIPGEWDRERFSIAMESLGLQEVTPVSLYTKMVEIAASDNTPFKSVP